MVFWAIPARADGVMGSQSQQCFIWLVSLRVICSYTQLQTAQFHCKSTHKLPVGKNGFMQLVLLSVGTRLYLWSVPLRQSKYTSSTFQELSFGQPSVSSCSFWAVVVRHWFLSHLFIILSCSQCTMELLGDFACFLFWYMSSRRSALLRCSLGQTAKSCLLAHSDQQVTAVVVEALAQLWTIMNGCGPVQS